ncbi:hypothetical protein IL306_007926, partial [Fusarium sp. DS 682]
KIDEFSEALFDQAAPRKEKGPVVHGENQLVLWHDCQKAHWKTAGDADWKDIPLKGQVKLEQGKLLYLYRGIVKEIR